MMTFLNSLGVKEKATLIFALTLPLALSGFLGPVTGQGPEVVFQEARQWQVASDATGLKVETGNFVRATSTGIQTINLTDSTLTPKVVFFYGTNQATEGIATDAQTFYSWMTATSERAVAFAGQNGQKNGNGRIDTRAIHIETLGGGVAARATFSSFGAGTFAINWGTINDATESIVYYAAIGGDDLENAEIGDFAMNTTTGNQEINLSSAFQPKIVFFMGRFNCQSLPCTTGNRSLGLGFGISSSTRGAIAHPDKGDKGAGYQSTSHALGLPASSDIAMDSEFDIVSMDSDGFTIDITDAPATADSVAYLALGGDNLLVDGGSFDQPTATGTQTISTTHEPQLLGMFSFAKASGTAFGANLNNSFAMTDGTNEGVIHNSNPDNKAPDMSTRTTKAIELYTAGGTPTLNADADIDSFNATSFILDWTTVDATAREVVWWTIGGTEVQEGVTVAGNIYTDEGSSAFDCSAANQTVKIVVNDGSSASTTAECTASSGAYTATTTAVAGDIVTVFLDDETDDATLVLSHSGNTTTSDAHLYKDRVIVRHDDAGPVTNADFNNYDSGNEGDGIDGDIGFTSDGTNLTVSKTRELHVWTGDTLTPGGTVTTNPATGASDIADIHVDTSATLSMGTNGLSIGGSIDNDGTLTVSSGHNATFTAQVAGQTVHLGSDDFYNVAFDGAGGEWSATTTTLTITNDLVMATGTLSTASGTADITVSGRVSCGSTCGTINLTSTSTFTNSLPSSNNFGQDVAGDTDWTFYNLTFNASGVTLVTIAPNNTGDIRVVNDFLATGTAEIAINLNAWDRVLDVDGNLTIGPNATFQASDSATFTVAGDFLNDDGTFTHNSGTITFDAGETGHTINASSSNFNNVVFNNASGGWSFVTTTTIASDLTMTAGTLDNSNGTSTILVNGGDVTGDGTINLTGETFRVDGNGSFGGDTAWTFNNLTFGDGVTAENTTTTGSGTVTATESLTIAANQTLDAGGKTWVLSDSDGCPCEPLAIAISGTFNSATSTFRYTGTSDTVISGTTYYNLESQPAATAFHELSDSATTTNNLTVGNGTHQVTFNVSANDALLDVDGDIAISANSIFTADNDKSFTVAGNFTNSGTFTHNNGITTLDGSSSSTVDIGASSFGNLSISKTSPAEANISTNVLDVDGDLTIASGATLDAETSACSSTSCNVELAQNFTNNGTFTPRTGTVTFDGTATSTIDGAGNPAITFNNLTVNTANKVLEFATSTGDKTFQIDGALTVAGTSGNEVKLKSTASGTQWFINHQGTENVSFASIHDGGCAGTSTFISTQNSIDLGNNDSCWLFPSLEFSLDAISKTLSLTSANTFTTTATTTLTVTTTATFGYEITAYATGLLTHTGNSVSTIANWSGTNAAPTVWTGTCIDNSECGFGYNTDDADLTQFASTEYAAFVTSTAGDVVAKSTVPIDADVTTITYRSSVSATQPAGAYETVIRYIITPQF